MYFFRKIYADLGERKIHRRLLNDDVQTYYIKYINDQTAAALYSHLL